MKPYKQDEPEASYSYKVVSFKALVGATGSAADYIRLAAIDRRL